MANKGAKVEVVTAGVASLLFINGHRVDRVTEIDTAQLRDELSPRVRFTLNPEEILIRQVSGDEFRRLAE